MLGYSWTKRFANGAGIEKDLGGFTFKGEGWYYTDKDAMLVAKDESKMLQLWVWNAPEGDPRDVLQGVISLPNLSDANVCERESCKGQPIHVDPCPRECPTCLGPKDEDGFVCDSCRN